MQRCGGAAAAAAAALRWGALHALRCGGAWAVGGGRAHGRACARGIKFLSLFPYARGGRSILTTDDDVTTTE